MTSTGNFLYNMSVLFDFKIVYGVSSSEKILFVSYLLN